MNSLVFVVFLALILLPYEGLSSKNLRKSLSKNDKGLQKDFPKFSKRHIWEHGKLRQIENKRLRSGDENKNVSTDLALRKFGDKLEGDKSKNRRFWTTGDHLESRQNYGGGDYGGQSYGGAYGSGGSYGGADYSAGSYGGGNYGGGGYSAGSYGGDYGRGFLNGPSNAQEPLAAQRTSCIVAIAHGPKFRCSGVIYNKDWVVTTGWCVTGVPHTELTVRAGSEKHAAGGCVHVVTTVAVPEMYRHFTHEDHNVGILKVSPPIELSGYSKAATLSPGEIDKSKEYSITGWGPHQNPSDTQKQAKVKFMDLNECKNHNKEKGWGKFITKTHICTTPGFGANGAPLHEGLTVFGLRLRGAEDSSTPNAPSVFSKFGGGQENGGLKEWIDATIEGYSELN